MKDNVFLDTNVFIYLYSEDEPKKQSVALAISERVNCLTSTQVLNEFCSVCLRKFKMPVDEILQSVREIVENCAIYHIDIDTIQNALKLKDKYGYSYYDCLVLASAILIGCKIIYSEDMQHNQLIEGKLKILNPFLQKLP